jgi:hypothetical protein
MAQIIHLLDGDKNKQTIEFRLHPAMATASPIVLERTWILTSFNLVLVSFPLHHTGKTRSFDPKPLRLTRMRAEMTHSSNPEPLALNQGAGGNDAFIQPRTLALNQDAGGNHPSI